MLCRKCGAQNAEDAKMCNACGAPLEEPVAAAEQIAPQQVVYVQPVNNQGEYAPMPNQPQVVYMQPAAPVVPGKGFAIASMVLGILSIVCGGLVQAILAIIFGAVAKKRGYQGSMATAGIITGVLGIVVWVILIVTFGGMYIDMIEEIMDI